MSSQTLLFLLVVFGLPLAMMLTHRRGNGRAGGCGMGASGHDQHGEQRVQNAGTAERAASGSRNQPDHNHQRGGCN
jgi:hypothetical protein